jgi:hypothetical protein
MAQPQPIQRSAAKVFDYLQDTEGGLWSADLEHVHPGVVQSDGPSIGSHDPEPAPLDTFPTSDTY